jgi:hypothetical protein
LAAETPGAAGHLEAGNQVSLLRGIRHGGPEEKETV